MTMKSKAEEAVADTKSVEEQKAIKAKLADATKKANEERDKAIAPWMRSRHRKSSGVGWTS